MDHVNSIGFECPKHHLPLWETRGCLRCAAGESFEVKDGIPRFVAESNYTDAFGAQWKKFRQTQLDSYSGVPITQQRIRRCLGESVWDKLPGLQVLECGCGAGRFTEILLAQGARVTSVDLSNAVEANQDNFPQTPGALVIDHYTYRLSEFTKTAALLRFALKRLSPQKGLRYTDFLVQFCLPLHKRVRRYHWAQMLLSRISPVLCYYRAYPQLTDEMQYQWALLDTHDSLTCWFRRFRTLSQIEKTLRSLGLQDTVCEYGGNGVEARGIRAIAPPSNDKKKDSRATSRPQMGNADLSPRIDPISAPH